jgi:hypothetical protein
VSLRNPPKGTDEGHALFKEMVRTGDGLGISETSRLQLLLSCGFDWHTQTTNADHSAGYDGWVRRP